MKIEPGPLLASINIPEDLRKLDTIQLNQVCEELRQYIIDVVSVYGGHFGGSLGTVELTVALHYIFNTPYDQLVWDTGHQAYGHKILTGRRSNFYTKREYGGLSGFPKRDESMYDTFGVGHSSTSISAALGMSVASNYKQELNRQHIAVIGDGAMTAGMAFEALNHAGVSQNNMIVVLNDNCMAIDPNSGALKDYLTDITTSRTYNKARDEIWNVLGRLNKVGSHAREMASKIENSLKTLLLKQSNLFESLKIRYFGPVDGHDVHHLSSVFEDLKAIPGPKLLHCVTTKGKGFAQAEKEQTKWHAPGTFDKITGEIHKVVPDNPQPPKYQEVFGNTIVELAENNDRIMGITPAMPSGSSMNIMMEKMPERAFDVGIAEQHAVTFSAGLATQGLRPFCNIYSSFMQRGYDQMVHDVAIQDLPVIFCLDRAGLAGHDGPTHHGCYDIAYMRCLPNMIVSAPMNEIELRNLMYTAQQDYITHPFSIRYPRGKGVTVHWQQPMEEVPVGKGRLLKEGTDVAVLSLGTIGNEVTKALTELQVSGSPDVAHYDMRFVKPMDEELLHTVFQKFSRVITVEDSSLKGGFGSAVLEFMADNEYQARVKRLGIPDRVVEHGSQAELYHECGYDAEAIVKAVQQIAEPVTK